MLRNETIQFYFIHIKKAIGEISLVCLDHPFLPYVSFPNIRWNKVAAPVENP